MGNSREFILIEEKDSIIINGKEYLINPIISLSSAKDYLASLSKFCDPKKAISYMIYKKILASGYVEVVLAEIEEQEEDCFSDIIEKIVQSDYELKLFYDSLDEKIKKSERFAIAFKDYWRTLEERRNEVLKKVTAPVEKVMKILHPPLGIYSRNPLLKGFREVHNWNQPMAVLRKEQNLYGKILQNSLSERYHNSVAWKNIIQPMHPIFGIVRNIQETYFNFLNKIKIPTLSEKRKQEIINSHKEWGKLGWSVLPNAPDQLFDKDPTNFFDADKVALSYCKKNDMDNIFNNLRLAKIKKVDLEEAIFCYENRKYKACALVLFGIIDSNFIRRGKSIGNKGRAVGFWAIKNYKEKTESDNEQRFFMVFHYYNLFCCLMNLFNSTDDFKSEKKIVNRNFLGHGMNRRKVRKKDCIQLFLALSNLMIVLER
jgi:hypothetical protein